MLEYKYYITLLDLTRFGMNFEKYYVEKDYSQENWEIVFELAKFHKISSLVYEGLNHLIDASGIEIDGEILNKWKNYVSQQKVIDMSQRMALNEITKKLEENSIHYYPFKGFFLKGLYKKSYMREMTDIDIYICQDDFSKIKPLVSLNGYNENSEYSDDNVLTMEKGRILKIEFQNVFFNTSMNEHITAYFNKNCPSKVDSATYCLFWNMTIMYIYLFCHLYKHLKSGGIGIRFILDLWFFETTYYSEIDWNEVSITLTSMGIIKEFNSVKQVMKDWFDDGSQNNDSDFENYIFSSGAFGTIDHQIFNKIKKEKSVSKYVLSRCFPPQHVLKLNYPNMKAHRSLLPYYWGKRAFDILLDKEKRNKVSYEFNVLKKK